MVQIFPRCFGSVAVKFIGFTPKFNSSNNYHAHRYTGNKKYGTKCSDSPPYRTRFATWKDHNDVLSFMANCYFRYEPILVNIGLSDAPPPLVLMKLMHRQLKQGTTLIAESVDDKCIIAAAVNVVSGPSDAKKLKDLADCCGRGPVRDVIEFFGHVTSKPNLWERFCVRQIFECSYLAVDPEYQGFGIGRRLVQQSWLHARDCGYRLFRIDCTSRYSAKIAAGFGWQCVCTIPFCRYVKNEELVFKHIQEPHTEVQVYVDRITYGEEPYPPYKKSKKVTSSSKLADKKKQKKKKMKR